MRDGTLADLVLSNEVRDAFKVSNNTILGWCEDGLDHIRLGRRRAFFVDELLAFLSTHRRKPGGAVPNRPKQGPKVGLTPSEPPVNSVSEAQ